MVSRKRPRRSSLSSSNKAAAIPLLYRTVIVYLARDSIHPIDMRFMTCHLECTNPCECVGITVTSTMTNSNIQVLAARSFRYARTLHFTVVTRQLAVSEIRSSGKRFRLLQKQYFQSNTRRLEEKTNKWPSENDNKSAFVKSEGAAEKESALSSGSRPSMISANATKAASFISRSMQDVAGRLSASTKDTVSAATKTAAKSITNLSSQAKDKATKSIVNLSWQAKDKAAESAKNLASKATDSGKQLRSKVVQNASGWSSSVLHSMQTKATGLVSSFGNRIASTVQSSFLLLSNRVKQGMRNATSGFTSSAKAQAKQVTDYVESNGNGVLRKLGWWTLAAIAVYGVATTVPKELVRVAFDKKPRNKEVDEQSTS